jgi:hypothetical protein
MPPTLWTEYEDFCLLFRGSFLNKRLTFFDGRPVRVTDLCIKKRTSGNELA